MDSLALRGYLPECYWEVFQQWRWSPCLRRGIRTNRDKMSETLNFKPYARLLTMLGDQLITNERVALVEIIKNAYDADADWVKVTFSGFGKQFRITPQSKIIIEDDGVGMTRHVLTEHWVSPATPIKKIGKETQDATASRDACCVDRQKIPSKSSNIVEIHH
jgi:hypothetical protein